MTKLSYSNRGGGRRGGRGGRAFVRGGDGAAGPTAGRNNTWVRQRSDDETSSNTSTNNTNDNADEEVVPASAPKNSKGPILKGPSRNHGGRFPSARGRFPGRFSQRGRRPGFALTHRTWRRDPDEKGEVEETKETGESNETSTAIEMQSKQRVSSAEQRQPFNSDDVVPSSATEIPIEVKTSENSLSSNKLKKIGRNKLVLSSKHNPSGDSDSKERPASKVSATSSAITQTSKIDHQDNSPENTNNKTEENKSSAMGNMIHTGSHKLILDKSESSSPTAFKKMAKTQPKWDASSGNNLRGGRKRQPPGNGPTIKRIKISVPAAAKEDGASKGSEEEDLSEKVGESKTKGKKESEASDAVTETLTDFAYRETSSSRRGRGGRFAASGRGGGRHSARGPNMGLVRVNPDQSKTPICPTFLRGVRCENERCTKRHDVPREYAMPVCSFFQRHGQCLKGSDCPFRHVKVNPRAMLCPSFNLLGYCEDEKCTMKHVSSNKTMKKNGPKPKS